MKSVTGRDFCKALERAGWRLLRVNGSHHIFGMEGRRERISVPVHGGDTLKPGLLAHFLNQSGLKERDLWGHNLSGSETAAWVLKPATPNGVEDSRHL